MSEQEHKRYLKRFTRTCYFCGEEKPLEQMFDEDMCLGCRAEELRGLKKAVALGLIVKARGR